MELKLAMVTANYVAEESDYAVSAGWLQGGDWGQCHRNTVEKYQGSSFEGKFERLINRTRELDFQRIELWSAHLDPSVATMKMIETARKILEEYEVEIIAYYGVGLDRADYTEEQIRRNFEVAKELGSPMLTQTMIDQNAPAISRFAEKYNIEVGWENHPEKSSSEIIEKIKPYYPKIKSVIDTGWLATYQCDASQVLRDIDDYLLHVHLKDVQAAGAHDSCIVGDGIMDTRGVLQTLKELDYRGYISIEHEPHNYDPTDEISKSVANINAIWNELAK